MASGNSSNKTVLYTYKAPDGTTITVWNDGTETLSGSPVGTTQTITGNQSQTIVDIGSGNHVIFTNNAGDTIDGRPASGSDAYFGGNGKDILYAGTGNDYLDGGNGVDFLFGGAANALHSNTTMLVGGNGGDVLVDGGAVDTFLYRATSESSYVAGNPVAVDTTSAATELKTSPNAWDIIVNFNSSKGDKIDLSLLDQQLSGSGPTKLVWLGSQGTDAQAGQANAAHDHGVWTDATGNFLYADTNGDGVADLKIQVHGVQSSNIVGIDNAPVIVSGIFSGAVTELPNVTYSSTTDLTGGSIRFTDADSADSHSVTVHAEGAGYVGIFAAPSGSFVDSTGGVTGTQGWSFNVTDSAIDFLGAGEHLTQKYDVSITDNFGASVTQVVTVTINGSIDAPTLSASAASSTVDEGGSVGLNISTSDVDDNANLAVTISGVPLDAQLSAGHNNGNGSWTLATADLAGLTITPDSEFSGPMHLTVGVTNTEGAASASAGPQHIDINVIPTADAPNLAAPTALAVDEGGTVALGISASALEADQNAPSIVISGLGGDTLNHGTNNGDGSYTLTTGDLGGLTLTVGGEETGPVNLHVVATDSEFDTVQSSTANIAVTVHETADAPNLAAPTALAVDEGGTVALGISASALEADQNAPSIVISGLGGDTLNHGTNNGDGSYTLTTGDLGGLTLTVGGEETGPVNLHVVATDSEFDTTAINTADIAVTVHETADAPNLSAPSALAVDEGGTVALGISASALEADQNAPSIVISGLGGDTLNHGTNNGDGSYTLTTGDLGGLTLTVGGEETGPVNLHVVATDSEFDTTAINTADIAVTVHETADAPNLSAPSALAVDEGGTVALGISASALEADQNAPSIVISGLGGDTLNHGTNNHDGSWTLAAGDLGGLTLTVGGEETGPVNLHVVATDSEFDTTQSNTANIAVTVHETADAPNLSAPTSVSGNAGTPILLGITASHFEGDQHDPSINISNISNGATFTDANHDFLTTSGGSLTLTLSELNGLALTDTNVTTGTLHVVATDTEFDTSASSSTDIAYSVLQTDTVGPSGVNFVLSSSGILAADNTSNGNQLGANVDIGTFVATGDPDQGDTFHYQLGGTDAGLFSLNTTTGELSTGAASVPVLTSGGSVVPYALTITAFDQANNADTPTSVHVWVAGSGADNLSGGTGIDIMFGMNGADTLTGAGGSDALLGGPNNDTLTGGLGADQLVGGAGKDTFIYTQINDSNKIGGIDTIYNFAASGSSQDTIDFSAITAITATQGSLANTGVAVAAHSIAWIESGGNTLVYANASAASETQANADMEIVLTGVNLSLTTSDFIHH